MGKICQAQQTREKHGARFDTIVVKRRIFCVGFPSASRMRENMLLVGALGKRRINKKQKQNQLMSLVQGVHNVHHIATNHSIFLFSTTL